MFISVDTPVAYSPFDATARDLCYKLHGKLPTEINHRRDRPAMQRFQTIGMVLFNLNL